MNAVAKVMNPAAVSATLLSNNTEHAVKLSAKASATTSRAPGDSSSPRVMDPR